VPSYVPVFVRDDRLPEVHRLLGETEPEVPKMPADPEFWQDPQNVAEHLLTRPESIRGLAKYLASRPDEEVTSEEAAEELDLPYGWNSLAGALGAFGRYCANRSLSFPWETTEAADGRVRFKLDAKTAKVFGQYL
jgi:hypothetical protein